MRDKTWKPKDVRTTERGKGIEMTETRVKRVSVQSRGRVNSDDAPRGKKRQYLQRTALGIFLEA
jgi:hypothetical protein